MRYLMPAILCALSAQLLAAEAVDVKKGGRRIAKEPPYAGSRSACLIPLAESVESDRLNRRLDADGFSATRDVTLSMGTLKFLLDLDTGQTMDPPAAVNRPGLARMLHPNQSQGYEAPTALIARGGPFLGSRQSKVLKGVKVRPAGWDAKAADVQEAMNGEQAKPLTELQFDRQEPATWFFRTPDGTDGILQLTGRMQVEDAVNEPWGLRLRYKTIPRDDNALLLKNLAPDGRIEEPVMRSRGSESAASPASLPSIRLQGEHVSVERLRQLEGKTWGSVTLVDGPLNGRIAHALARANSIHTLRVFGGDIAGNISWLDVVPGVVELELGGTIIARDIRAISEMAQLERLKLPQEITSNISGARSLAQLVNLKSLGLYHVDIDDASFSELASLVHLEDLDLTHTRVTDDGLKTLAYFPRLKQLHLHRFPSWFIPEQLTDEGVLRIVQLRKLEVLSISGKITDVGLKRLAALPNLKRLELLNTEITADGLAALKNSPVEYLMLDASLVDLGPLGRDSVARHLRACRNLKAVTFNGSYQSWADGSEPLHKLLPGVAIDFHDP